MRNVILVACMVLCVSRSACQPYAGELVDYTRSVFLDDSGPGAGVWTDPSAGFLQGTRTVEWKGSDWKSFAASTSLKLEAALVADGWTTEHDGAVEVNWGPFFVSLKAVRADERMRLVVHVFPKDDHECYLGYVQTRIVEAGKAEPGATDNPDDAQRLREDH